MDDSTRNLAWKLNWYRQSELEGALLLGRLVRLAPDPILVARLTRHCADEARHAQVWADTIERLGLPYIAITRSYQSLFAEHGGPPAGLGEVLAFTQVFEQRVHKRFTDELARPGLPAAARDAFAVMLEDEKDHLEWVFHWLRQDPASPALLARYRAIDELVYRAVLPHEDAIWELGIGREFPVPALA